MRKNHVFTFDNAKTSKGESLGFVTAIRYLAPGDVSGFEVCANRGACGEPGICLYSAGRGRFAEIQQARIDKTVERFTDKTHHFEKARREIRNAVKRAGIAGMKLAVRLNGTSDLPGDAFQLAREFPEVQFYDYTKIYSILDRKDIPVNMHYTLSYDPVSVPWEICAKYLARGFNVAIAFAPFVPTHFNGVEVIAGDNHDLRFLDGKRGVVVGLTAKGNAKKAGTADAYPKFVVDVRHANCAVELAIAC